MTLALRGARSSRARSPKKPPGPSDRHLAPVALDVGPAVEDHEELGAGGTLGDHHLARGDGHVVGRLRHHLQLLLGAGGEEGHGREGLDEGIAPSHAPGMYP